MKYPSFSDIRVKDEKFCLSEVCDKTGNFYLTGDKDEGELSFLHFTCRGVGSEKKPRILYEGGYVESKGGTVKDFPYLKDLDAMLGNYAEKTWGYKDYHISANEAAFLQTYFTLDFDRPEAAYDDLKKLRTILIKGFAQIDLRNGKPITSEVKEELKRGLSSLPKNLTGKELALKESIENKLKLSDVLFTQGEIDFLKREFGIKPKTEKIFPEFYSTLNQLGFYSVDTLRVGDKAEELSRLFNRLNKIGVGSINSGGFSDMNKVKEGVAKFVGRLLREDRLGWNRRLTLSPYFGRFLANDPEFKKHFIPRETSGTNWSAVCAITGWVASAILAVKLFIDNFFAKKNVSNKKLP